MNPRLAIEAARLAVVQLGPESWAVQGRDAFSYVVRRLPLTRKLTCPCVAASFGNTCRHRIAVSMRLQQQAKAESKTA